jgi:hypothetical protein
MALQATDSFLIDRAGTPYKIPASDVQRSPVATGYAATARGAVTQLTSRVTAVTLNTLCGAITLFNKTTTAGLVESFVVNNSNVAIGDTIIVNVKGTGIFFAFITDVNAGSFRISIHTPAAQTIQAPVVYFTVIKS